MKNKTLKKIVIILIAILVIELIYFGIKYIKVRKESTYYSAINSTIKVNDKYVSVGLSDFKHSKFNKYKAPGYNKATLFVYDKNLKLIKEKYLDLGLVSEYKDIVKVEDGYIAVGYVLMDEKSKKDNLTEAVIVKYDNNFNIVWRKNLNILDTSKFNKVKVDKAGNYVVVGTSVYAPNIIGNHTTGGAIIVKYDKNGEVLSKINLGGPQTGEFNDLVITNDGYVVVGLKATGTGAIYKYSFDGKELWHNYYGITDKEGLTSIKMLSDGSFIVTGSKLEEKNKTQPHLREAHKALAREVITFLHGKEAYEEAVQVSQTLFSGQIQNLTLEQVDVAFEGVPTVETEENEMNILDVLILVGAAKSKREAREFVNGGSVLINGERIKDLEFTVKKEDAFGQSKTVIRRGKKNYFVLKYNG